MSEPTQESTPAGRRPDATVARSRKGRIRGALNWVLPVREAESLAATSRDTAKALSAAGGALAASLRAVRAEGDDSKPTVLDEAATANREAIRSWAWARWCFGVFVLLVGAHQFAMALFMASSFLAAANFALSAVFAGLLGIYIAGLAARDAQALKAAEQGRPLPRMVDVLRSPSLWVPW